MVQVASLAGSVLTVAATLLTGYANDKKLDSKIEEKVADALTFAVSPKEYAVSSTVLRTMVKKLIKTNGICPSIHEEWDSTTPTCDKECPCRTFMEDGECRCGLYIKLKKDDEETDE